MTAVLDRLAPDLWVADGGTVSFFGVDYPTRMAVVRLSDGDLWVWSPIALSGELEAAVRALGPVRDLVSPNKLHHLFLGEWRARFPDAKLWGTASTIRRFPKLPFAGTLTDTAPFDWAGQIDQWRFDNAPFLDEMIFFHRQSRTAIICDFSQPFSRDFLRRHWPAPLRWLAPRIGMVEGKGYGPLELRLTLRHRKDARSKMQALIAEDPERVVVAHGEIARHDGAAFLRRAFAWLL
jgi:hypothetical protein